jgi:hypothetical protein
MPYAACLFFDAASSEIIAGYWRRIDSLYLKAGSVPHISLAVFDAVDVPVMEKLLREFALDQKRTAVSTPSAATFLNGERVIFLAPVVTRPLLELHSGFYDRLIGQGISFDPLYRPGNWVPHCTLDMELSAEEQARKMEICAGFAPLQHAELTAIGLIEFRPVKELFRFMLQE